MIEHVCFGSANPVVVATFGPVSSGKSTLARSLKEIMGMQFFDMSNGLRESKDPVVMATMNAGGYVDDTIVNRVLESNLQQHPDLSWSLCGVARTLPQAKNLWFYLNQKPQIRLVAIEVHRSFEHCNMLRLGRAIKEGRTDDNSEDTFWNRWQLFEENMPAVRKFLESQLGSRYLHLSLTDNLLENKRNYLNLLAPSCGFSVPAVFADEVPSQGVFVTA